jgi:uncharacterized membrane protein YdbT with pleckstrin-like domain
MNTSGYLKQLLGRNEQVLFLTRQHWSVLAAEILSESVLTLALIVLVSLVWNLWGSALAALGYLVLIFPLVSLTRDVLLWSNRQFVITNRRVIQVAGVVHKDVIDSSLEKVNDVKMEQTALGRLLDYGDLEILTASELGVNLFHRIAHPIQFKTAMLNAREQLERAASPVVSKPGAPSIPDLIAQLDQLRKLGVLTEAEFQAKKAELMAKL